MSNSMPPGASRTSSQRLSGRPRSFRRFTPGLLHKHESNRSPDIELVSGGRQFAGLAIYFENRDVVGVLVSRNQPVPGRIERKRTRNSPAARFILDQCKLARLAVDGEHRNRIVPAVRRINE